MKKTYKQIKRALNELTKSCQMTTYFFINLNSNNNFIYDTAMITKL